MPHAGFVKCCGWLMLVACPAWAHRIDPTAEIHPTVVLIGNVTVGAYTRIGPKAVIQGDITIGHHVNILGNAVVSADRLTIGNYVRIDYGARVLSGRPGDRQYVRDDCWIGMNATVRGSRMEEGSAVGNGAVADFNTHLEKGAVLAHGATTRHDTTIAANALAEGRPAQITRSTADDADRDKIFGLIPVRWIHYENDKIAGNIDANPPKRQTSYPGVSGKPAWTGTPTIDPTAKIHPTAIIQGKVTIGAHTRIGPGVIIGGQCTIGSHCDIRANTNIRATTTIGDYVFIGERVHVGASRDGGSDDPLWIKSYSYISPGSTVHATRVDAEAYYGANVTTDYGSHIGEGALLLSGASVRHDERIRDHMIFEGNPGLQRAAPGISGAQMMEAVGFQPRKWLTEVMGPALENSETYEAALNGWEHVNKGTVKGQVQPGATLVGNVNIGEGSKVYAGAYLEGNITVGKSCAVVVDVMIVSNDAIIGDHTHIYDKATIVDGRPADKVRIGLFNWINHLAALQGVTTGDFAISNIGVSAAYGTEIGPEALLLNNSATYAGQKLPAGSISWGEPAMVRVLDSTMWEREFFFYGKSFPTWQRQATAEELKTYKLPR